MLRDRDAHVRYKIADVTITVYPKGLVATAVFMIVFGALLAAAIDAGQRLAVAGGLAVLAYFLVELLVTFNPAAWWQARNPRR